MRVSFIEAKVHVLLSQGRNKLCDFHESKKTSKSARIVEFSIYVYDWLGNCDAISTYCQNEFRLTISDGCCNNQTSSGSPCVRKGGRQRQPTFHLF